MCSLLSVRPSYKILFRKPEWKRTFVIPRRRWEDNIRVDLREIEWEVVYLMHLSQYMNQCLLF